MASGGELCAVCGQTRTGQACEACGATAEWIELAEAHEFARRRFADWHAQGLFDAEQMARLQAHYERRKTDLREAIAAGGKGFPGSTLATALQCFSCLAFTDLPREYCPSCSVRMTGPGVRSLRCWHFLRD